MRANGVQVYGYVPIGVSTENRSLATLQTAIDQWDTLNVDGIFLDEFGFDYQVTRSRQIDVVNYVHGKGLSYCANAWVFEDFVCTNISEVPWPSNDWRYINFQTYNPGNLPLPRTASDPYLIENFLFEGSGTGIVDKWDGNERYDLIRARNAALSVKAPIWACCVFIESPANSGNINQTKIGSLTLASLSEHSAQVSMLCLR